MPRNIPDLRTLSNNPVQLEYLQILFKYLKQDAFDCADDYDVSNLHAAFYKFMQWHKEYYRKAVKANGFDFTDEEYDELLKGAMNDWKNWKKS